MTQWREVEILLLRMHFTKKGARYVAGRLGRSIEAVSKKARSLGVRLQDEQLWTEEEDVFLKKRYHRIPAVEIARKLGRSRLAVQNRASALRITARRARSWTDEERRLVIKLYPDRSVPLKEISMKLSRSIPMIKIVARKLGAHRGKNIGRWSKKELMYLSKHYRKKTYAEIARYLGISKQAVASRAVRSKLHKTEPGKRWTVGQINYLRSNYKRIPTRVIAEKLGRSKDDIWNYAGKIGISSRPRVVLEQ